NVRQSFASLVFTPLMSLCRIPSKLPAQACPTFCFRSLATSSAGSSPTKRRKGQRERLTFVSTITPGILSSAGWVLRDGACFRPESIFSPIQGCRLPRPFRAVRQNSCLRHRCHKSLFPHPVLAQPSPRSRRWGQIRPFRPTHFSRGG